MIDLPEQEVGHANHQEGDDGVDGGGGIQHGELGEESKDYIEEESGEDPFLQPDEPVGDQKNDDAGELGNAENIDEVGGVSELDGDVPYDGVLSQFEESARSEP